MVRSNRIKQYRFPTGSLVANSSGTLDIHIPYPLNGLLQAIQYTGGNYTATGSFELTVSGTGERLTLLKSGIAFGNNVADGDVVFPRAITRGTDGSSQSGLWYGEIPINSILRLTGSGLGNAKSGTGFNIGYI
ncbi:hypothetical protein KAI04_04780 [Candidatus Pacearchaeota archaeon]|nr:hypothetical protein [Candidatus Pacearchaeota archaeon]